MAIVAVAGVLVAPHFTGQVAGRLTPAGVATVTAGPTTCTTGSGPYYPAYDPVNHDVYVPNLDAGTITVLNGTCNLVGTITLPTGASPEAAAFSPANNEIYVTDDSLNHVYAIQGLKVLHTVSGTDLTDPIQIVWDPGDGMMLVTNSYAGDDVVGIRGSSIVGTAPVGSFPGGLCYDPYFATIIVVNYGSENVTILNAIDPFGGTVANLAVGFDPEFCAFDPADDLDYVTNLGDNNVSVITGSGLSEGSVNVGAQPMGIAWDQSNLRLYVGDQGSGNLSIISGLSVVSTVKAGIKGPEGLVLDEYTNKMYVASFLGNKVYVES